MSGATAGYVTHRTISHKCVGKPATARVELRTCTSSGVVLTDTWRMLDRNDDFAGHKIGYCPWCGERLG
mgnify:CR=1 FL=1